MPVPASPGPYPEQQAFTPPSQTLLVADGGSTKIEWRVVRPGEVLHGFQTGGLNPHILPPGRIREILATEVQSQVRHHPPSAVAFFGAGLSSAGLIAQMESLFRDTLHVSSVYVAEDLLGAARAAAGNQPGFVGILGTGSNACLYDGRHIRRRHGGQGFLFGDEGSGADLGRRLIKGLLDETLPPELGRLLEADRGQTLLELRDLVYASERPNAVLAGLMPWMRLHLTKPAIHSLVRAAFRDYFAVSRLKEVPTDWPVYFVGSVAWHFQEVLCLLLGEYGYRCHGIVPRPIEALARSYAQMT